MRRSIIFVLAATLILGLASMAAADTISWNNWQDRGLTIKGQLDGHSVEYNLVGSFDVSWSEGDSLTAFCVDLLTGGVGGAYDVTNLSLLDPDDYSYLYQAAWIMDNYSPALDNTVAGMNNTQVVTAIQSALWTLTTYPGDDDTFKLTKVYGESKYDKGETMALYTQMLAEAGEIDFSTYSFKHEFYLAESDRKQDLLIGGNPVGGETPEPGTMLLLGSALGVFAWRRRRKNA